MKFNVLHKTLKEWKRLGGQMRQRWLHDLESYQEFEA